MTILNLRGCSGAGKSTLVHRFLAEHKHTPIYGNPGGWKKKHIIGYRVHGPILTDGCYEYTYVVGSYKTACGGCDSLSYKGSHTDIENMIRRWAKNGNVCFEGLTISSSRTKWLGISKDFPGQFVWCFMDTPEEVCYERILARSGREPKRDAKGWADYQYKYRGCLVQKQKCIDEGERVEELSSDEAGYQKFLELLKC